jgi:hypothetical protein
MAPVRFRPYSQAVSGNHNQRALTFGRLFASARETCGSQMTAGIARLAVKPHTIERRRHDRFVILGPGSERISYTYE